ncbi:MAG: tetratricopeptide repeat protein [Anaerolineae bacterium]|nr:tetratricopeptide repeat protein [Anaerolineae bacterium]
MPSLLSAIAPYVPYALIQSVLQDATFSDAPTSERFPAGILFADVSGFTPLTEALARKGAEGPEEMRGLLNRYFNAMIVLTEAEGGSVVKFSGDAMTVLFPAKDEPLGHAVRRAYQAAVAMQTAMHEFDRLETSVGVVSLGMKIAIGAGEVLAMQIGGIRNRWEYVIAGDPLRQVGDAGQDAQRGDIRLSLEARQCMHPSPLFPSPLETPDWSSVTDPEAVQANLLRFVPGPVQRWLNDGLTEWVSVLRPMTVLFVGVEGLQYEQPDAVLRIHNFLRTTQQTLYRYEGTLRQFVVDDKGTVVMALFGAPPLAHEDDPRRAALCALHLKNETEAQNVYLAMGIATGHVFSGPVGGEARYEYTAMGDTVNLAARLMGKAGAGKIMCEYDTYRQARNALRFENLPPIRVKGKAGLIRVYSPMGEAPLQRRLADGGRASIVGRDDEIARLASLFDTVSGSGQPGESRVLIIEGDAGIGKTRLVTELTRMTKERGLVWLIGAGQNIEQQTPYRAWRDILTFYFGLEEIVLPKARQERVETMVRELAPDQVARIPLLNDVLDLGFLDTDLTASLDPQLHQQGLVALLLGLLRAWALESPLVLILEDAQWLDSLSWALTVEVARAFTNTAEALLLVIVTRPLGDDTVGRTSLATLQTMPAVEMLLLYPLDPADMVLLVADRLGIVPIDLPQPVADLVHRLAEGNPFFAEELIFALRDQNVLEVQEDQNGQMHCVTCEGLDETVRTLPDTIQGLILARIDRQPPERQLVLKTAAVIGRTFGYAPLRYVLQKQTTISDQTLKPHLDALEALNFTPLTTLEPDLTYTFRNIATQEVAYETLLFSQRRALHRTAAEWYERELRRRTRLERYSHQSQVQEPRASYAVGGALSAFNTSSSYLPLLVYHFHHAEMPEKERIYARLAGEQAAAQFANTEALRYLTRALELTPQTALAEQYEILLARETIYTLQGNWELQRQDMEALEKLAQALDVPHQAEVALRRAQYAEVAGDYAAAIAAAQDAIQLAHTAQDLRREAAGYLRWGRAFWMMGNYEDAVPKLEKALVLARRVGYGQVEADSIRSMGVIAYHQGNQEGGMLCFQQALSAFNRIGDRRGEAGALNNLGVVFYNRGDYSGAQEYYQQSLKIFRDIGHRQGEGRALGNLGIIAHCLGNYAEALEAYEQSLAIYRAIGYRQGISTLLSYMSLLFHHQGQQPSALEYGLRAQLLAQDLGDPLSLGFALTNMGHAMVAIGQLEEAAEIYDRAVVLRREAGQLNFAIESLAGLAHVSELMEEHLAARIYAEEILAHLQTTTLDGTIEPFRVYLTCYRILRNHNDPRARLLLEHTYALLQTRAATITDPVMRQAFLENISAHREIVSEFELYQSKPPQMERTR